VTNESPAPGSRPWRVLIADDDTMARGFMAEILGSMPDIEVVAQASDGSDAVELARLHRPDAALIDVNMRQMHGPEATAAILGQVRTTNVAAVTAYATDDSVDRMLAAGALGFLLKDSSPDELIEGVRTVAQGDGFVSPQMTTYLIREHVKGLGGQGRREAVERFEQLSERERNIAVLVAEGASNPTIADRLHLSPATVKTHLEQVNLKLGAANRSLVAVMVERAGFGPASL
jgi:DNA-binding NarL/FixJ family response regulator